MAEKIAFSKPTIGPEEIEAVTRTLKSGWLAAGPETEAFEKEFAKFVGVKYAIFTSSGTSALKMAYKYASECKFTMFSCSLNTYCATYAAGIETGLMFKESDIISNCDIQVNVHYGSVKDTLPCYIEDSAHRIEPNDPLIGKIRCYSFYVTKNMTTGSGGMLVTNSKQIYDICRLYWNDGLIDRKKNILGRFAGGYDGNDIAASMGRVQLKKLTGFNKRRNEIRDMYNKAFGQKWQGNHLYPYPVDDFNRMIKYLEDNGIEARHHYIDTCKTVSLPIYPLLKDSEVKYIIKKVKEFK